MTPKTDQLGQHKLTFADIVMLIPIVSLIAAFTYGYSQLNSKIDYLVQRENEWKPLVLSMESRLGTDELEIRELKVRLGMR